MELTLTSLVGFAASEDLERSGRFYGDVLGLRLVDESEFALVYDVGGTQLRVTKVRELFTAPYTTLGWRVDDVAATVAELRARGVPFERYDSVTQDDHDVWTSPSGARIAWFRDPDGNTLSLQQESG